MGDSWKTRRRRYGPRGYTPEGELAVREAWAAMVGRARVRGGLAADCRRVKPPITLPQVNIPDPEEEEE